MAVGSSNSFDLVVLGGGTGGYSAAFRAAQMGLRTALVEEARIGGTCLHWGCIPTKAMLESADLYARIRDAATFGLRVGDTGVDMGVIARRRTQVVDRLTKGLMSLVKKNQVEFVHGHGVLERATKVRVALAGEDGTPGAGGERLLDATDVILATGSRVKSLPGLVPDGTRIVTSDDVLRSDSLPESLIVVGAGAVGVEFASFYRDMGVEVTLLEYLPSVVPLEDAEVGQVLERAFRRRGIAVMTSARFDPAAVTVDGDGVRLSVGPEGKEPKELRAEQMLVATGRAANVEGIGLEKTRAVVERGVVKVDGRMRTARAAPLRHRRPRRRAPPRARRRARGDHRGRDDLRAGAGPHRLHDHAPGDLLAAADRVHRPLGAGAAARRRAVQGSASSPGRPTRRRSSAASTTGSPRCSRTPRPTRCWACTSWAPT